MSARREPRRPWPDCCSYSMTSSPTTIGTVYGTSRGQSVGLIRKLESFRATDENGLLGSTWESGDASSVDIGSSFSWWTWRHLALLGTNPSIIRTIWPYFVPFQ